MKRVIGILLIVMVLYAALLTFKAGRTADTHRNMAERLAMYGILTLGVGAVIISGGIDLSIGSVFALAAVSFGLLLNARVSEPLAVLIVLTGGALVGLSHGLLITRLRLQPFIVTLCGLFVWRGLAYWLALPDPLAPLMGRNPGSAGNVGIGEREQELQALIALSSNSLHLSFLEGIPVLGWFQFIPYRVFLLLGVAALLAILMHVSVYGRYLYAIGANEQAARYAGIPSDRYKILAYVLCSVLASLAGMLQLLEVKTVSPSNAGSLFELYAITGAVLGGCSLRGGEGTVIGMLLGTAVLPLLRTLSIFSRLPSDLEYMVIGIALLGGTIADELLKRRAAARG